MTPNTTQLLKENFDYDLWANRRWISFLESEVWPEELAVFAHIIGAGQIWLARIEGESPADFPTIDPNEGELFNQHRRWHAHIDQRAFDEVIAFRRIGGTARSLMFGQIALHVTNHGTYHRGHLRGLFQARGCDSFPETDRMVFSLE